MNMNAQELIETLEWRYATKVFNPDRRIPAEDWEALLESLHLSPSSLGLQMWKFLDVRDPAVRSRLREVSWGQPQVTDASHLVVFCARRDFKPEDVQLLSGTYCGSARCCHGLPGPVPRPHF